MAIASPEERLDPFVSLAPAPVPDETPQPAVASDIPAAADGALGIVASSVARTSPSGFPTVALAAALGAHVLVAAAFYILMLHEPPEEAKAPAEMFQIELAADVAGRVDGTATQAPDGAPPPDALQEPDARAPVQPADTPATDPVTAPHRPTQPPSFAAMPAPATPQPVPTTADAWVPRVQSALDLPLPPPEPKPADVQDQPKTDAAKPEPTPKPVATPPKAPPPVRAPAPPAPPPSVQAAAPPVLSRPTLPRSVDVRDVAGLAPSRTVAAGSSTGNAAEANYASLLFRAIDRVRFYPMGSRDRGEEGRVTLRVTIAADGRLLDAYIERGSGFPELDAATMEMVRRAAPYPPLPAALGAPRASFDVPIIFGIRRL